MFMEPASASRRETAADPASDYLQLLERWSYDGRTRIRCRDAREPTEMPVALALRVRDHRSVAVALRCIECGATSRDGRGWRGYRVEDPENPIAEPEVAFYCPACAAREFDAQEHKRGRADGN